MSLSKVSLETVIDLVEIRLACVEVYDREDARELKALELCRKELEEIRDGAQPKMASAGSANGRQKPPARVVRTTARLHCKAAPPTSSSITKLAPPCRARPPADQRSPRTIA